MLTSSPSAACCTTSARCSSIPSVLNKPARLSEEEFRRSSTTRASATCDPRQPAPGRGRRARRLPAPRAAGRLRLPSRVHGQQPPRHRRRDAPAGPHQPARRDRGHRGLHDACSSDRPHRTRLAADMVWHTIRHAAGAQLNREMVEAFLGVLPPYPRGTQVEVLDGRWRDHSSVVVARPHRQPAPAPHPRAVGSRPPADRRRSTSTSGRRRW